MPGGAFVAPDGLAVSPAGNSLYVSAVGSDSVTHFGAAPAGQLNFAGCVSNDGSAGACADVPGTAFVRPFTLAMNPVGNSLYVVAQDSDSVTHFGAVPTGQLTFAGCVSQNGSGGTCADVPGAAFDGTFSLALSPTGNSLYVSADTSNSVTHFGAVPTGQLTFAGCVSQNGSGGTCADVPGAAFDAPSPLAVNPAANSLYVAAAISKSVSHFGVAPAGQLNFAGCVSDDGSAGTCADVPGARLDLPTAIAFSSDGDSVYVADFFTSSVLHFAASPTGQLTFVDCVSDDGSGGFCTDVPGAPFLQPSSLAVSPDNGSVYVTDPTGGTFTHFTANATGRLDFAGCMSQNGSAGACTDVPGNAFGDPRRVAISPDGDSVYVTAGLASSVTHFAREVPPPANPDTDPPGLTLTTKEKSQAGKPIKVKLACDEPCTVDLTGSAKPKGGKRKGLGTTSADLATGTTETLTLKPKGKLSASSSAPTAAMQAWRRPRGTPPATRRMQRTGSSSGSRRPGRI